MWKISIAVLLLATQAPVFAQPIVSSQKLVEEIEAGRLTDGDWKGSYKLNRMAAGLNFYLTDMGLLSLASDPAQSKNIEDHLDVYLRETDPVHGWVSDVDYITAHNVPISARKVSDSDDAYAALPLLLIADHYKFPEGKTWWRRNNAQFKGTNGTRIKQIVTQVILDNLLPSGLPTVYSKDRDFMDRTQYPRFNQDGKKDLEIRRFKQMVRHGAYLMDSCQVWAGLNALCGVLAAEKDPDLPKFRLAAQKVARGIAGLYNEKAHAFYILDLDKAKWPNFYPKETLRFYPHYSAQAFPELYGVPLGDASTTRRRYYEAWKFLNSGPDGTRWTTNFPQDGSTGNYPTGEQPFPWMILGYAAAKRGDYVLAKKQLDWYEKTLVDQPGNWEFRHIQEVGPALQIQRVLASVK